MCRGGKWTNGAVIKGFEEDVGSRTTHYTFSTNTLMNSMRSYGYAGYHGPPVSTVRTQPKGLSFCQKCPPFNALLLCHRRHDMFSCPITTGITC
ncbi:hypothetical protein GOODEAATRI_019990 [Goodea atripinnis]|uniref:alpha-N-acetylgalactosaminide alpha-2,6-sialyltransferase n=1 Tax=Goodea atripinnis TaxID=208336 RepID=A0ABV0MJ98_9TELE